MIPWIHYRFVMVDYSPQPTDVAELILHRMVHVPAEAKDLGKMLSHWYRWNENGLELEDVQSTKANSIAFAGAACLLYALGKRTHTKDARYSWASKA